MNNSYIDKLNKEYLETNLREQERETLIQENNIVKRDISGYHGREILELLQNADDAYRKKVENLGFVPEERVKVSIEYKDNVLIVSNTGTTFDHEGVKAIVQGNISPKGSSLIGNKGTGFRSVLNWAKKIQIFSGEFNLEFSKEFVTEEFSKIKHYPQIQKQLKKKGKLSIPVLSMGKDIEPIEKHFDTVIKIFVDMDTQNDDFSIINQINNIDEKLLLFLPSIDEIEIKTEDATLLFSRETVVHNEIKNVTIRKEIYDNNLESNSINLNKSANYFLFEKKIRKFIKEKANDEESKDIEMAIAVPEELNDDSNKSLYSYFPIHSFKSPFNCLLHATFILDDQRNNIYSSTENRVIFDALLSFLIEVSRSFFTHKNPHFALSILSPILIRTNSGYINEFKLFEYTDDKLKFLNQSINHFYTLLENEKVFPTILGERLSLSDGVRTMGNNQTIPNEFRRKEFEKLLAPIEQESSRYLLNKLEYVFNRSVLFREEELCSIVNGLSEDLSIREQTNLFVFWNSHFSKTLPKLIKNHIGDYLEKGEECYFLVGDVSTGLPSWVKVPALDIEYQKDLLKHAEINERVIELRQNDNSHITRIISQNNVYPLLNFKYSDRSNIITAVNRSVNTYNKAVDFIKWLWSNYKSESNDWSPPFGSETSPVMYKFPTKSENFVNSKKIFFGESNGYPLSNTLFTANYEEFVTLEKFGFSKSERSKIIKFFSKFGVLLYPSIETTNIKTPHKKYKELIESNIKRGKSYDFATSNFIMFKDWHLNYIDDLVEILNSHSFYTILKWISLDSGLRDELKIDFYYNSPDIYIESKGNKQSWYRLYRNCPNYILFLFNPVFRI